MPLGDGRECLGIPGKFNVIVWKRLVRLQASCRVSVTKLLNAKAGRMIGMCIVCPAQQQLRVAELIGFFLGFYCA